MKKPKGFIVLAVIAVLILGIMGIRAYNQSKEPEYIVSDGYGFDEESAYSASGTSYYDYLAEYISAGCPDAAITILGRDFIFEEGTGIYIDTYEGMNDVICWTSEEGSAAWEFEVSEAGFYNLSFNYSPITIKGNEIQLGIMLDGSYPYTNAETITLPRTFLDITYNGINDNGFLTDLSGNEIRPKSEELFLWKSYTVRDNNGQYSGPLKFYLSEGVHRISLVMEMEGIAIESFTFYQEAAADDYQTVLAGWDARHVNDTSGYELIYQAEKSYMKTHNTLFPTYDKGSAAIMPSSPAKTLYNTIGKNTWENTGQSISWEVDIPEDGYYNIAFKVKQNTKRGMYSARELRIDNQVLFSEMESVKFNFNNSWYMQVFENKQGEAYKIYLTKGIHTISMTVVTGDASDILRRVDACIEELNHWYREIIKITGTNADSNRITIDSNRDFLLDEKIPGMMEGFAEIKKSLESVMEDIKRIDGIEATSATIVSETIALMESFIKKPGKIANRIESYRGTVSSLATWTIEMRAQPVEMDYFVLYSPDVDKPKINSSFFSQFIYRSSMFLNSFVTDYNALGSSAETDDDKVLTVWINTADMAGTGGIASGRDQAMLLKRLIDDMFTPETGISVQVSLVNSSATLTKAVLAGKGPDAALFVSKDTPVNLAMRGALLELSAYDDFDAALSQFMPSAIIPYEYRGKYYALPETQSYDMLFYRTDIFEQLSIEPPDTWEDFYALIPILMEENYTVGIPESQRTFEMFLYQKGGTFYNEDLSKTAFDTKEALQAFEEWTGLYAKYSLPLVFDFFNRFRTGEMPMAVMPYTQVNYLSVAAPEIKNQWAMAPIPGTVMEDGTINRAETANGTASIILADTKYPDEAYEFLKWWVSAEVQSRFGIELEQNMGAAARYPTANVAAFGELPWTKKQAESLMEQWKNVTDVPQIPGNYYISRNISFAFRAVVYKKENERESLFKYNKEINKEIARKLKEFEFSH